VVLGLGVSTYLLGGSAVRLMDPALRGLALTRFLELPLSVWIALAALAVAIFIQYFTRLGLHITAIGAPRILPSCQASTQGRAHRRLYDRRLFYGVAASWLRRNSDNPIR